MGDSFRVRDALEKRVTDGTEAEICEFSGDRPVHDGGAVRKLRYLAQDGTQMEGTLRGAWVGGAGGAKPGAQEGEGENGASGAGDMGGIWWGYGGQCANIDRWHPIINL